jgi:hypothetical protein
VTCSSNAHHNRCSLRHVGPQNRYEIRNPGTDGADQDSYEPVTGEGMDAGIVSDAITNSQREVSEI